MCRVIIDFSAFFEKSYKNTPTIKRLAKLVLNFYKSGARKGVYRSFSPVKAGIKRGKIVQWTILRRGRQGVPLPAPTTTLIKSPNLLVGLFSYTFAKYSDIIITISDVFWVNLDVFINYNWSY